MSYRYVSTSVRKGGGIIFVGLLKITFIFRCCVLNYNSSYTLVTRLQDPRTIRKIVSIDEGSVMAFAGLTADARVLINKTRLEAQSYRLTCEDAPSVEYLARYIARTQQRYTQRGGVRPFGIATLLAGFSQDDGKPVLYQTDPAGTHSEWKAQVIGGRNAKSLREFLEKNWEEGLDEAKAVRMGVQALLEVVDSGAKNMEICVVRAGGAKSIMDEKDVDAIVKQIEAEAEEGKITTTTASSIE